MTIDEIAQSCHTSKGQISKYVKQLGYSGMKDLKDACNDSCSGFQRTNNPLYDLNIPAVEQYCTETDLLIHSLQYSMQHFDSRKTQELINDLHTSKKIYVYGHGHTNSICSYIQTELSARGKNVVICDVDFSKTYKFQPEDLLLILSIDGNTFYYESRVISRIVKCNVNTWLITCNRNLNFSKNTFVIPADNHRTSDYVYRHFIHFLLQY